MHKVEMDSEKCFEQKLLADTKIDFFKIQIIT
jgi:hypothetical protein